MVKRLVTLRAGAFALLLSLSALLAPAAIAWLGGGAAYSPALQVTTSSLTAGTVGTAYGDALAASGGVPPYSWQIVSDTPNTQLWQYVTYNGTLSGTPQNAETDTLTVQVNDSAGHTAQKTLTLQVAASGALTILSPTSLSGAASNGYYAYQVLVEGGQPPYSCSGTSAQPWQVTPDCWIEGTPTATGTYAVGSITVTDSVGTTASFSPSVTIGSTLTLAGVDPVGGLIRLPAAHAGDYYQFQFNGYGGSGTGYTYSTTSSLPGGLSLTSGGVLSGTPTSSGAVSLAMKLTDSSSNVANATALLPIGNSPSVARPSYNSSASNGFFVLNGHFYDPNGHLFVPYGVDRTHFDSNSWASDANGALTGANVVREFFGFGQYTQTVAQMVSQIQNEYNNNGIVPIVTVSNVQTAFTASASGTTLTVSAVNTTASTSNAGVIVQGMTVVGAGIPSGANWTASAISSSTSMSVTAIASGPICVGMPVSGTGFSSTISAVPGGGSCSSSTGTYTLSSTVTFAGGTVYGKDPTITTTGGGTGTYTLSYQLSVSSESMTGAVTMSGNTDPNAVVGATNMLVYAEQNGLSAVNADIIINVANEWGVSPLYSGPNTEANWESDYATAVSSLRTAGYYGPILIDTLNDAEDFTCVSGGYAQTLINSDSYKNVAISFHLYNTTNLVGQITGISHGTNATITFAYPGSTNPWSNLTNFLNQVYVTGVSGMTQINGQTVAVTSIGTCSAGSCTLHTSLDTSSYGTYSSGGQVYDGAHYQIRLSTLAGYISSGIPIMVGEFGPPGLNNTTAGINQFVASAAAYGVPEMEWAWDDNNQGAGASSWSGWFSNTLAGPGTYARNAPSGLTESGMIVVLNPRTGTSMLGVPPTVLH